MRTGILVLACWVSAALYRNLTAHSVKPVLDKQRSTDRLARIPVWLGFALLLVAWA